MLVSDRPLLAFPPATYLALDLGEQPDRRIQAFGPSQVGHGSYNRFPVSGLDALEQSLGGGPGNRRYLRYGAAWTAHRGRRRCTP